MNIHQLLSGDFLEGGWGSIPGDNVDPTVHAKNEAARALADAEQQRIAHLLNNVFGTPDGQKVLVLLTRMTIRRKETDAERAPLRAEQYAVLKAHRAGQAAIVNWILDTIEIARGDQQKPAGGDA